MIFCKRVNSASPDFQKLVNELDAHLAVINGTENEFFAQFNKTDRIDHVVVAYKSDTAAGCGAMKEYEPDAMEMKRMFVRAELRGQGIAAQVLAELEAWAKELGYKRTILETSKDLLPAIGLYTKSGYRLIDNYGQYAGVASSVCFEKTLG
ncbi:MAG: GNAT family N-acetyltransferase [Sphingobacteriales bacterium]|nr:MAG: GNAT family N-acetyltransferase [Sphingobacteriales bacterium]